LKEKEHSGPVKNGGTTRFGPVLFVPGERGGRYPFCNSLYIEEAGIVIDPASDRACLADLRDRGAVRTVWLSHFHEDHFADLDLFEHLPIGISEEDAPPMKSLEGLLDRYGITDPTDRTYWGRVFVDRFRFRPRVPSFFFREGDTCDVGGDTVQVLATPGHTPGHVSLLFRRSGILFLGDYDLSDFGPWYGDASSSIEDTLSSIRRLRNTDASLWISSHERGILENPPGSLWDRYEDVVHERERKLLAFLSRPRTFGEIVQAWIAYGKPREPARFYEFAEGALMGKHLERLVKRGWVHERGGRYVRTT